jgi:hypothetical protein
MVAGMAASIVLLNLDLEPRIPPLTQCPLLHDGQDQLVHNILLVHPVAHGLIPPAALGSSRPVDTTSFSQVVMPARPDANLAIPYPAGSWIPHLGLATAVKNMTFSMWGGSSPSTKRYFSPSLQIQNHFSSTCTLSIWSWNLTLPLKPSVALFTSLAQSMKRVSL